MPKAKGFRLPKDVDGYSLRGARMLCTAIKAHWQRIGYKVRVEPFLIHRGAWGVRSALVNGLPVGFVEWSHDELRMLVRRQKSRQGCLVLPAIGIAPSKANAVRCTFARIRTRTATPL